MGPLHGNLSRLFFFDSRLANSDLFQAGLLSLMDAILEIPMREDWKAILSRIVLETYFSNIRVRTLWLKS